MSEKLKRIAELIKSAQSVEPPPLEGIKVQPKAPAATSLTQTVPNKAPTSTTGIKNAPAAKPNAYAPEVKNMQEAIQEFARAVTAYSTSKNPESQKAVSGKKAFNDFITEGFMDDKPIKGVEWTTDKAVTSIPEKQKTQSTLFEMNEVVDGLNRLGSPKSEMTVDGVWGPRTQNAISNIVAFAKALMEIDKKFTGKDPTEFKISNLKFLEAAATVKKTDFIKSNQKQDFGQGILSGALEAAAKFLQGTSISTLAQNTANTIKVLTLYYTKFLSRTLNDPKNTIFIQQDKSLDKVTTKEPSSKITEEEKAILDKDFEASVKVNLLVPPNEQVKTFDIPVIALSNKEKFKEFWEQYKIRSNDQLAKIINDIKVQLGNS